MRRERAAGSWPVGSSQPHTAGDEAGRTLSEHAPEPAAHTVGPHQLPTSIASRHHAPANITCDPWVLARHPVVEAADRREGGGPHFRRRGQRGRRPIDPSDLSEKGVPGTFFLTGKWVETYPDYAADIGATYPVANHSYSHPDLTTLSLDQVREEITRGAAAIEKATGRDTHPMFRFPFGASDQATIDVVNSLGYGAINWTVDTRGWQGTSGGQSVDLIVGASWTRSSPARS